MKKLMTAIALTALIATPTFAATVHHGPAQSTRPLYMYAPNGSGDARDAAVHECSVEASKWSNSGWETTQFAVYGTCMAAKGQQP